jgi:ATP synthase F1 complex assembly factor 1
MKAKDLEELKKKVGAPSTQPRGSPRSHAVETPTTTPTAKPVSAPKASKAGKNEQAAADRSGIKVRPTFSAPAPGRSPCPQPLSQILNLDLVYAHPHTTADIAALWQHYHTAHPTLSSTFLSATIPPHLYASMVDLARRYPNFVVPLPRDLAGEPSAKADGDAPAFEMFYLQWLFHPTPSMTRHASEGHREVPPQPIATVLFTPLAEFKNASEWAQPHLVLTHYPDLANNPVPNMSHPPPGAPQYHPLVLMRGEISPATTKSAIASPLPGGNLALSQAQAQLLALALQRFYCSAVVPPGETVEACKQRVERGQSVRDFRERPAEWDWKGLVRLAYAGVV